MSLIELTGRIAQKQSITGTIGVNPITISGKINRTLPKVTVTFKDGDTRSGDSVVQELQISKGKNATYSVPAKDGNAFLGWVLSKPYYNIIDPDMFSGTIHQSISNVQSNVTCWAVYSDKRIIHDSWEVISQRSAAGTAQNYYNVGDMKRVHVQGNIGVHSVNADFYASIADFDHNSELEGTGITFFGFWSKWLYFTRPVVLVAFNSPIVSYDGRKTFNMNHWSTQYGVANTGWGGCDMRYDILGSTDQPPDNYGSQPSFTREGHNPTSTCATEPVQNTLMSCLPSDLRAVMKPMTKYTLNGYANDEPTATIDYLPLMSAFEHCSNGSEYSETTKQKRYLALDNKVACSYDIRNNTINNNVADSWTRSLTYWSTSEPKGFCSLGLNQVYDARTALGIDCVFLV